MLTKESLNHILEGYENRCENLKDSTSNGMFCHNVLWSLCKVDILSEYSLLNLIYQLSWIKQWFKGLGLDSSFVTNLFVFEVYSSVKWSMEGAGIADKQISVLLTYHEGEGHKY